MSFMQNITSNHAHAACQEVDWQNIEPLSVDDEFLRYFKNLKQVFLYITDECNLRCVHCLYKPNLVLGRSITPDLATRLLRTFRNMGAFKLTLIGGEATLYGADEEWRPLFQILNSARGMGYQYIRLDTNGQFCENILQYASFKGLDELSFSIDGPDAQRNDILRGAGTFEIAVNNVYRAVREGYRVHVTTCVTRQNVSASGTATRLMEDMIRLCEDLSVNTLNFHGVFRMGVPMDTWTEGCHIEPSEWYEACAAIGERIAHNAYNIHVRLPLHVVLEDDFSTNPQYYGYCPCKLGERVLIHPSGIIRICSSLLSTPYGVARYDANQIRWMTVGNELYRHALQCDTPCTNQQAMYIKPYVPVCFSLKPRQFEPVWQNLQSEGIVTE